MARRGQRPVSKQDQYESSHLHILWVCVFRGCLFWWFYGDPKMAPHFLWVPSKKTQRYVNFDAHVYHGVLAHLLRIIYALCSFALFFVFTFERAGCLVGLDLAMNFWPELAPVRGNRDVQYFLGAHRALLEILGRADLNLVGCIRTNTNQR